jgi:hypothetical protein
VRFLEVTGLAGLRVALYMLLRKTVRAIVLLLVIGCCVTSGSAQSTGPLSSPQSSRIICGRPGDKQIHIPPDWTTFKPPAAGQSFPDPVFGCTVTRITDGSRETLSDGAHPSFMNFYSTVSPMNSADTMVLITSNNGAWHIRDINGRVVVPAGKMPAMNSGHPVWDAREGSDFYYALGKTLYRGTVNGDSVKSRALHIFKEYRGVVSPDAADLSQDGDHLALMGQNADNSMDVFVWSLTRQTKTSAYTTKCKIEGNITETSQPGCVHKLLLSADNLLSIGFVQNGTDIEQGVRLWNGSTLIHLQDSMTSHYDHGYDMNGNPIVAGRDNPASFEGFSNPCQSGWGLDIRQQNNSSSACLLDNQPSWHISYRGSASQPWAVISFFDDRKPGPELFNDNKQFESPSSKNWQLYEDEIVLVRIDGSAVYRLAHARSRSAESYWAQPHAVISRDGRYMIFTSNMAYPNGCPANMHVANECSDVYLIKVR